MAGSWRSSSRPSSSSLIPEIQRCHGKNLSLIQEQKEQKERKKEERRRKKWKKKGTIGGFFINFFPFSFGHTGIAG